MANPAERNAVARIINKHDLPGNEVSRQFEGYLHGDVNISFFLNASPPGHGPTLHTHTYEEVFIIQSGTLTFTVGEDTIEATAGQIVIAPANVPHKFVNSGDETAIHINLHVNDRMKTTWVD